MGCHQTKSFRKKKSGFVLVWWGFKKDFQIVWKWKMCHYCWCRFQPFSYLPNQTADQPKNITTVSAGSSKRIHLQWEREGKHSHGRLSHKLAFDSKKAEFEFPCEHAGNGSGLWIKRRRRASYLTVRLVVQNVDLLCCLRNWATWWVRSNIKDSFFFSIWVFLLCLTLSTDTDLKRLKCWVVQNM